MYAAAEKVGLLKKHFLITVQTSVDLDNILRAQNGISINNTKFQGESPVPFRRFSIFTKFCRKSLVFTIKNKL